MNKLLLSGAMLWLSLFDPAVSRGCLNDYTTNQVAVAQARGIAAELTEAPVLEPWGDRLTRLRKEVDEGGDYQVQNDLATALIHMGFAEKAIPILQEIEKGHPGLYRTATNLGTAYELAGDPGHALEWIRKGIERNPEAHERSEWIHMRILEAKVAHAADPKWWPAGSLLGLDFGESKALKAPAEMPKGNTGKPVTLEELQEGLKHQLQERLQFVRAPDAIVASLLADYGDTVALTNHNMGVAHDVYAMAAGYIYDHPGMLMQRIDARRQTALTANLLPSRGPAWWGVILIILIPGFSAYMGLRQATRRRRGKALI